MSSNPEHISGPLGRVMRALVDKAATSRDDLQVGYTTDKSGCFCKRCGAEKSQTLETIDERGRLWVTNPCKPCHARVL